MSIEFIGSILIFVYALAVKNSVWRVSVTIAVTLSLTIMQSYFAFFFAGMLIADTFLWLRSLEIARWIHVAAASASVGLFVMGVPDGFGWKVAFCSIFVLCVVSCKPGQALFSTALFQYLGRTSFALYLVHMPVIVSLQSYLYLAYRSELSDAQLIGMAGTSSILMSLLFAHFFAYIDRFSITISRSFAKSIVG